MKYRGAYAGRNQIHARIVELISYPRQCGAYKGGSFHCIRMLWQRLACQLLVFIPDPFYF